MGEQHPSPALVIPTKAREASAAERPAFHNAGSTNAGDPINNDVILSKRETRSEGSAFKNTDSTTNAEEQKHHKAFLDEIGEEEGDQPWPSPESAYWIYERLRKRHAEKLAAEERAAQLNNQPTSSQPPAA